MIAKLIVVHASTGRTDKIEAELSKLDDDSIFLLWDAFKIVIVNQNLTTPANKFVKANSRNSKNSKDKTMGISRKTVYIGEFLPWLKMLQQIDPGELDDLHGDKPKYSTKGVGKFTGVQLNFEENTSKVDLDSAQDWVDADFTTADEDDLESKIIQRLTKVFDKKLAPLLKLAERVEKLEANYRALRDNYGSIKTKMSIEYQEKLQKLDVKHIEKKQEEIDAELEKLKSTRKEFDKDFNDAMQSTRDKKKFKKSPASVTNSGRFHVWGRNDGDTGVPKIPRVFNFAASKIPNTEQYTTDWLKEQQQKIFDRRNIQAKVIQVEQIKAKFLNARTKTFRVLIRTEDMEVTTDSFLETKMWIGGLSISKYRRPRALTEDLVASPSGGLEQ